MAFIFSKNTTFFLISLWQFAEIDWSTCPLKVFDFFFCSFEEEKSEWFLWLELYY